MAMASGGNDGGGGGGRRDDGAELADLLEPLIDGIVERPPWGTFVDRLRDRTGADYASLVFRPMQTGPERNRVVHLYSGQPTPPDLSRLYHDILHATDPMPYQDMAEGRVYALPELLRFGDPVHESYFRDFLAPSGMNVLRMMRVQERGGISAWITLSRRRGDFDPAIDSLLGRIGPGLRAAVRGYVTLERERTGASVANEVIRRMNFGWITLDGEGRILDADSHGARLLEAGDRLIRGRGGRLGARDAALGRDIARAIRDVANNPQARPRALVLNRDPWLDMLLVPSAIDSGATRPAPAIIAYVHADNWSSADRCDQLCQLFDLIPCEARLALALGRGMSIAEAAVDLGLTIESARTYSKRIYARTGARGQAELVRYIHRSVLAIA